VATSASYAANATSASYALTASYWSGSIATASYAFSASQAASASYWSGSIATSSYAFSSSVAVSSSYALTASFAANVPVTASYANQANSASYALTASYWSGSIATASYALSASQAASASYWSGSIATSSFSLQSLSASLAQIAISASFATTAAFAMNGGGGGVSAIYISDEGALQGTASYFDFNGSGVTATVSNGTASITIPGATGGGGVVGQNAILNQSAASATWSFSHNLGTQFPVFTIFDSSNNVIIPQQIYAQNTSSALIYFSTARSGTAVAALGGGIVSSSYALTASYAPGSGTSVSSSYALNATTSSYALTASYLSGYVSPFPYTGSAIISGSLYTYGNVTHDGTISGSQPTNNPSSSLVLISGSIIPASGSVAGVSAVLLNTVLSASANNQTLVGLDINPTFTNGAFTGVTNAALRVNGNIIIPYDNTAFIIGNNSDIGIVKKYGSQGFYAFGSLSDFIIAQSNTSTIYPSNTFTNKLTINASTGLLTNSFGITAGYSTADNYGVEVYNELAMIKKSGGGAFIAYPANRDFFIAQSTANSVNASNTFNRRLTINQTSGNVLINTSTDAGYRLDVSGSTRLNGNTQVTGSLNVSGSITTTGTITAQTLVVQTVTSSIIYSSGSNVFGNSVSNTQQFTGSVSVTGSLTVLGSPVILANQTSSMSVLSSSYALTSSYAANVPVTASYANQANSASYALTASFAANVPVTASYANQANSASYASIATSSSYALTSSYALNAGAGAGFPFSGSAVITGSLYVSGSSISGSFTGSLLGTASYATQALSSSFATYAISASNAPGFTVQYSQATPAATWSFNHNLNTRNPIVQVYDSSYKQIIPNEIVATTGLTTEIRFDHAETGYVVFSNGGGLYITGSMSQLNQNIAAVTWSFQHNLNSKYVNFEVYDPNDLVIIPAGIRALNSNQAELYFGVAQTGIAVANFSGISGSTNAMTASYALTSEWTGLNGNPISASSGTAAAASTTVVASTATGSYYAAFFDYAATSGSNSRAGTVMSVWNAGSISYNEVTTNDIGNTSQVTMSVDLSGANVRLKATTTTQWTIRSLVRLV
jgi:hypothetical protein